MLFKFKYSKLTLFLIAIILALVIFSNPEYKNFALSFKGSYLGIFVAGFFFSLAFPAPFSTGFFITLNPVNIPISALVASLGAVLSNMLIFYFINFSFKKEIESFEKKIEQDYLVKKIELDIRKIFNKKIRHYLLYAFAGFLIASPLPNEAGNIILAGIHRIKGTLVAVLSLILSFIGIAILMSI